MKNSKKSRVSIYSLYGASIGIVIATTILISSYIYSIHFDTPDPEAWVYVTSFGMVQWIMAYPVQFVCNLLLGEDNFIEEHLLLFTAVLSFFLIGLLLGWIIGKLIEHRNK